MFAAVRLAKRRPRTAIDYRQQLDKHVFPRWGNRAINELTRVEIFRLHHKRPRREEGSERIALSLLPPERLGDSHAGQLKSHYNSDDLKKRSLVLEEALKATRHGDQGLLPEVWDIGRVKRKTTPEPASFSAHSRPP
jgi:hypothetical protein